MNIVFGLAILIIIGIVGAIALNVYFDKPIEKKYLWIALAVFVAALAVVAYCTEPMESDDLFRHFKEIDRMKSHGLNYVNNNAVYRMNPVINYLFYVISLLNNNYLLPFISVIIIYGVHLTICGRFYEETKVSPRILCVYILLFFALVPIRFSISNIRIVMAYALLMIAIYRDYMKEKRDIVTIIFYIAPMMIHSSSIIVLGLRILDIKVFKIYKIRYLLLFWYMFSEGLSKLLYKIPVLFFKDMGLRLFTYIKTSSHYAMDSRLFWIQMFVMVGVFYINYLILKDRKDIKSDLTTRYMQFVQLVILFTIGAFANPVIYVRLGYFIAFLILPSLAFGYEIIKQKFKKGEILMLIPIIIIILGLYAHQVVNAIVYWRLRI